MKLFGMHVDRLLAALVGAELAIFVLASASVQRVAAHGVPAHPREVIASSILLAVLLCLLLIASGGYQREAWRAAGVMVRRMLLTGVLGLGIALLVQFTLSVLVGYEPAPPMLIAAGAGALGSAMAFRLVGLWLRTFMQVFKPRVVMLGAGARAARVLEVVHKHNRVRLLGVVPEWAGIAPMVSPSRLLAEKPTDLVELARELRADEIVVAVDDRRNRLPMSELLDCRLAGIAVLDDASFVERERGLISLSELSPSWLIFSDGFAVSAISSMLKRIVDIVLALLVLVLIAPLLPLVALAIRLDTRGPVFYFQTRVGYCGTPFRIFKFRSMVVDAESDGQPCWASARDPRITRVGNVIRKCRIDELPQIFNVLVGDMSFVGPRPERPEFVAELTAAIPYYQFRHRVRPGLTGWAQVNYQYGASVEDSRIKLEYDLYYLKHRNLALDALILLQTVRIVLSGDGAH